MFTTLAFKSVMGFAKCVLIELEKLSESVQRKVPFGVFLFVNDCGGQRLFVGLALEDLFFDRSCRDEAIDKA